MPSRDREETPEVVSIHFRRDILRRIRRSVIGNAVAVLLSAGGVGGVVLLADEQDDIKEAAVESKDTAVKVDTKVKAVDQTNREAYTYSAGKDAEQDARLGAAEDRFNDLRDFCIATRSSGNGRRRTPPPALAKPKPSPIPPTINEAANTPPPAPAPSSEASVPDAGTPEE